MQNTKVGNFEGTDEEHHAHGKVSITGGLLKLENIDIADAPDPRLILTRNFDKGTGVNVAPLKNFTGNDEYSIPADTDISKIDSVIIWCDKAAVTIAKAALS